MIRSAGSLVTPVTVGARLGWRLFATMLVLLSGCMDRVATPVATGERVNLFDRPWQWSDERGAAVTFSRWRGSPLVVTAIYTSCTTRCPLTIEKLHMLDAALRRNGINGQFVLVTLDPRADTLARLRGFEGSRHFPPSWHLLRGDREETLELGRMLGVRATYDDGHIDHDVRIAVFDALGRLVQNFGSWDFDENRIAKAL